MVSIKLGKLLHLAAIRDEKGGGLLQRFFQARKPVSKYFCNRHLAKKVFDDVTAGFAARDAIHKEHGGTVNADGIWEVPEDKRQTCNAEVQELHAKVLEYADSVPVSASDLTDFAASEAEMEALSEFLV